MARDSLEEVLRREAAAMQRAGESMVELPSAGPRHRRSLRPGVVAIALCLVGLAAFVGVWQLTGDAGDDVIAADAADAADEAVDPADPGEEAADEDQAAAITGTAWDIVDEPTSERIGTISFFPGGHYIFDVDSCPSGTSGAYSIEGDLISTVATTTAGPAIECPRVPGRLQVGGRFRFVDGGLVTADSDRGITFREVAGDVGDAPPWLVEQNERFAGQDDGTGETASTAAAIAGTAWEIVDEETGARTGTLSLYAGGHFIYEEDQVACGASGTYTVAGDRLTIASIARRDILCPPLPGRVQYGSSFGIVDGALAPASARSGVVLRKVAGDVGDAPDWLVEQNERFAGLRTDTTPTQDAPARAVDLEARVLATSGPTLSNRAALPPVAIADAEGLETILSTLGGPERDGLTVDFAEEVVLGFHYRGDCVVAVRATFQRGDGYRAYPASTELSGNCDAVFHERYVLVAVPRMHDEPTRAHLFGALDGWDPTVVSVVPVG